MDARRTETTTGNLRETLHRLEAGETPSHFISQWRDGLTHLRARLALAAASSRRLESQCVEAEANHNQRCHQLQSLQIRRNFVLEDLRELEEEDLAMRNVWVQEGVFGDVSLLDVEGEEFDQELDSRAAKELEAREKLQGRLQELGAKKQTLLVRKAQEMKLINTLEVEVEALLKSMEGSKPDVRQASPEINPPPPLMPNEKT